MHILGRRSRLATADRRSNLDARLIWRNAAIGHIGQLRGSILKGE